MHLKAKSFSLRSVCQQAKNFTLMNFQMAFVSRAVRRHQVYFHLTALALLECVLPVIHFLHSTISQVEVKFLGEQLHAIQSSLLIKSGRLLQCHSECSMLPTSVMTSTSTSSIGHSRTLSLWLLVKLSSYGMQIHQV